MKWTKPSGLEIETNDREETIDACIALGWKPENLSKPAQVKTVYKTAKKKRK